ncbi:hypothetical protein [Synechococcus sp. GFB01]|uniref:hypothetical protein n=1 Tax=Synechococcus sp. GFB01 TaxID=1662190 RepID=UPI00064F61CE|nr:hypothetical protein [Synechococcus sp. GFB01]KMM17705.1 hypothetical protein SYNGFB01_02065 [Synechococcus sp. GFB01]
MVGKSWYSLRIHTHGRVEILHRGKAFSRSSEMPSAAVCGGHGLLLGPSSSVSRAAASCGSSSLVVLEQDPQARLTLARLQPAGT